MSAAAKVTLGITLGLTAGCVVFVHWRQQSERAVRGWLILVCAWTGVVHILV